ncbi:MAG: CoA transferase [Dehalococcoidales bacterium]|nr:CoA transferase [Dehalococcoidales bacterium]
MTDNTAFLCGKILADLGAEVVKIEKPGGDPARMQGPFFKDKPGPNHSLTWLAYNAGKKGITLDIEAKRGQEIFKGLATKADIVVESFAPGYLDKIGLGYKALSLVNPKMILTSITPFGQEGPYRDYKASSLVLQGACGFMYITGDPDRPPVQTSFPLPYLQACTQAVAATMVAYYCLQKTGQGQHVDVAAQHSSVLWGLNAIATWQLDHRNLHRAGQFRAGRLRAGANPRYIWKCKDGYVAFNVGGGGGIYPRVLTALMKWMDEEDKRDDFLKQIDWYKLDMSKVDREYLACLEKPIADFFMSHTKAELYEGSVQRRVMLYPVQTFKDIAASPQLKSRDFWVEIEHDELGVSVIYPGPFTKSSLCQVGTKKRAPLVGEHNEEVYGEAGLSKPEMAKLRQSGVI